MSGNFTESVVEEAALDQEPPTELVGRIVHHHFPKSETGRYGFFPRTGGAR